MVSIATEGRRKNNLTLVLAKTKLEQPDPLYLPPFLPSFLPDVVLSYRACAKGRT